MIALSRRQKLYMRLDSYSFRNHLIKHLESTATAAKIVYDSGDVIWALLPSQQRIEIHLIERPIETQEIFRIYNQNRALGVFTLYLMWCDMLLPNHDEQFKADSWMLNLHTINRQRLYSYKVYGAECFIYPVHLERVNRKMHTAYYGASIKLSHIGCAIHRLKTHNAEKEWLIVDFDDRRYRYQQSRPADEQYRPIQVDAALMPYFTLLGIDPLADRRVIRRAYRQLAQKYHPDINNTPEATIYMQRINEAYRHIVNWLEVNSGEG